MSTDPFEGALVFEGELPLLWSVVDAMPSDSRLASVNVANEALIRSCETLEDSSHTLTDESVELAHELLRIESKLNLVLELLSDVLRRQADTPDVRTVRFNAAGLEWSGRNAPPVGSLVRVDLYACPGLPRALEIYGEVISYRQEGDFGLTTLTLRGVSQSVADGLERMVFRRHRREVAQIRGRDRSG